MLLPTLPKLTVSAVLLVELVSSIQFHSLATTAALNYMGLGAALRSSQESMETVRETTWIHIFYS
jgi:hypothetical protein